ncbi:MAG: hypothetical protein HY000_30625 [Planctomycetes bacterium]|nr:hypothetical protein [Planctomycetota bacterium]
MPSLLGVPFYLGGRPSAERYGEPEPSPAEAEHGPHPRKLTSRDILQAATSFQTPFVTAATAAILFFSLCRLAVGQVAALATALVYALGTLAMPYSDSLYVQPVAALGLACTVASVLLAADTCTVISLAFLLAVRLEFLVLLPVLTLHAWRYRQPLSRSMACLMVGAGIGTGLNVWVNYLRGDPLVLGDYGSEAFSTPVWLGLHGLLFATGKGLVWFAPAAAAGLLLMPRLLRDVPRVGFLIAGVTATLLLMIASWWTWHGGWSWGPRLLVPLMPVLVLPLAWVFDGWQHTPAGTRWVIIAIAVASVAVQLWGTVTDPVGDRSAIWPLVGGDENASIYIPQTGPWGVQTDSNPDLLWWRIWVTTSADRHGIITVVAVLTLTCLVLAWYTLRSLQLDLHNIGLLLPSLRPPDRVALPLALVLLFAPKLVEVWLTSTLPDSQRPTPFELPPQFSRMATVPSGSRLFGELYVPIKGDYAFYQQGPPGTQVYLDGRAIFAGGTASAMSYAPKLEAGFHSLDLETRAPGSFNVLYWTTPGNAYYKQPVPLVYVAGRVVTWKDRAAIVVAHWKWLWWAAMVVAFLFVLSRDSRSLAGLLPTDHGFSSTGGPQTRASERSAN